MEKPKTNVKAEKPVKEVKAEKPKDDKVRTIAKRFQIDGAVGAKSKDELATIMLANLKKDGVTKTKKGTDITKEVCLRQINAMVADIKKERGKDHGSWWSKLEVVDEKDSFKIKAKA